MSLRCYLEDEHIHDEDECCECGNDHCCGSCPVFFPKQEKPDDPTVAYAMWFNPQTMGEVFGRPTP